MIGDAAFVARPIEVRAFRWDGPQQNIYPDWFNRLVKRGAVSVRVRNKRCLMRIAINAASALMAEPGYWIVNRDGTLIVHPPQTFAKLYAQA